MPTNLLQSQPTQPIAPLPTDAHIIQVVQIPAAGSSPSPPPVAMTAPPRQPIIALLAVAIASGACLGVMSALLWQNQQLQTLEAQNALLQSKLDRFERCLETLR